jgi:hypothetical protein
MAIEIRSFNELDPAAVTAMTAKLAQYMQERHPEVELTRGVFHDLVLYFNSMLNAAIQENIDRVRQSQSLQAITENPELADAEIVDQVLSNYNITRDAGSAASGNATIIFNLPLLTTIGAGGTFTANDVVFTNDDAFTILPPDGAAVNQNDRVMVPVGDGTYAANIVLRATTIGVAGNIKRGTTLQPNFVLNNASVAFAAADFVGGRNPFSNVNYIAKLADGLAAKTIGGRQSYAATIRTQPAFKNVLHVSTIGCGDAEQTRDQHSLFPISGGGKVDVYVQTNGYGVTQTRLIEATYIETTPEGTKWQFALGPEFSAGFYEVTAVRNPTDSATAGYAILNDIRGVDATGLPYSPDIRFVPEGVYSRYQTVVIQFIDTDVIAASLVPNTSRAFYAVTTTSMPLIAEINDFLTDRDRRARGTDILVKAPIPCFTKISFEVLTEANVVLEPEIITNIKNAVVSAVADVGFSGQLNSSIIGKAAHAYLTGRQAVGKIDLFGRIRRPDGQNVYLRDPHKLVIPHDPARLVTGRTTAFLVGPDDVSITSVTAGFFN